MLVDGVVFEAHSALDNVVGDVGETSVVSERVPAQPDHGLGKTDLELDGDHSRCLVHDVLEVGTSFEFGGQYTGRCVCLHDQQRLGGDVSHHERVGMLVYGELSRVVAVQVEGAKADRTDL